MQYTRLLLCFAALIGSSLALPTPEVPKDDVTTAGYTGAGGRSILNGVDFRIKRDDDATIQGYTGAGGVAILNGVELPAEKRDGQSTQGYTGAGGVAILNGVELPEDDE